MPDWLYAGNMIKRARTWHWGGGDNPLRSIRYYRFSYDEGFLSQFIRRPHKIELNCDFVIGCDAPELAISTWRQAQTRHVELMNSREFYIKDRNVLDWFDGMAKSGASLIQFEIDSSAHHVIGGRPAKKSIVARFSDPGLATMFKLAFGGV